MPATPKSAIAGLIADLHLEETAPDRFIGHSPLYKWGRIYGGLVVGQALMAAARTVQGRDAHSLHCYFIRPGDPREPIAYEVDRLRDGGSFTTRRVVARQKGEAILSLGCSFHNNEPDGFEHQRTMPDVPAPETLPDEEAMARALPKELRGYFDTSWPFEFRLTDLSRILSKDDKPAVQTLWMRARGSVPKHYPPMLHQCLLGYASDWSLLDTTLVAHHRFINEPSIQAASLDHVVWFHRPFRVDDWLLFHQDSPSAQGSRGLALGSVFARDGRLVATIAQEGLIRKRTR
jgi:acyl-CoA thioesterase-2